MMRPALSILTAAVTLGVMGCDLADEPVPAEGRGAAGEVLGGEITDDMLPLDTVQSTSPPAPRPSADAAPGATPATSRPGGTELGEPEQENGPEPLESPGEDQPATNDD